MIGGMAITEMSIDTDNEHVSLYADSEQFSQGGSGGPAGMV